MNEAFRLARQMLESLSASHHLRQYPSGSPQIPDPSNNAQNVFLSGLNAEIPLPSRCDPNKVDAEIDNKVIMHVFNTYAAYTPPHLRTPTLVVADQSKTTETGDTSKVTTEVTAALTVEGSQADSNSSSAPSLVLEDEN